MSAKNLNTTVNTDVPTQMVPMHATVTRDILLQLMDIRAKQNMVCAIYVIFLVFNHIFPFEYAHHRSIVISGY